MPGFRASICWAVSIVGVIAVGACSPGTLRPAEIGGKASSVPSWDLVLEPDGTLIEPCDGISVRLFLLLEPANIAVAPADLRFSFELLDAQGKVVRRATAKPELSPVVRSGRNGWIARITDIFGSDCSEKYGAAKLLPLGDFRLHVYATTRHARVRVPHDVDIRVSHLDI